MRRLLLPLALWLASASSVAAQVTGPPFTFVAGTVANPAEVNTNFSTIYNAALNRTGGTMTGSLTAQNILAAANNTYDIGTTGTRFKDAWFAGTVTAGPGSFTTLAASSTSALTGNVTVGVNGAAATLFLNGPAASNRMIQMNTAGTMRWQILANNTAESGSNAGSDFVINAYTDAGAGIGTAMSITRSTMAASFAGPVGALSTLSVTGNLAVNTNKFTVTALTGNTTVAGTLGVTGDVAINTNKFNITAASGNTTVAGTLGVTGDFAVNTNKFTANATSGNVVIAGIYNGTGTGTNLLGAGGTGTNSALVINGANAVGGGGYVQWQKNGTSKGHIGTLSSILGSGTSDDIALYAYASAGIQFFTNNSTSTKWGINPAGDWTFGASNHIADSSGTPGNVASAGTGCPCATTIAGTDYALTLTQSLGNGSSNTVTFGHTFSTTPVCVTSSTDGLTHPIGSLSTTGFTLTNGNLSNIVSVICRGY
jgi:hypothetical protein